VRVVRRLKALKTYRVNGGQRLLIIAWLGLLCWAGTVFGDPINPHDVILRMESAYQDVRDYTALFLKRERIRGTLRPLEKIEFRFQSPFKVYMAWREPHPGRTIVYVEGENNNKMQVNPGGLLQMLRFSLDPSNGLATRNNHQTIRQAGLGNLIDLILSQYWRGIKTGQITLRSLGEGEVDGRPADRLSLLCHADQESGYYAKRADIWIDKAHHLPTRLLVYDWNNQLYAHYEYHRLKLNPGLSPKIFKLPPVKVIPPVSAESDNEG
jgi:outer membrane lipoprotein-sorting protein